jgi:hypothetical protein
MSKCMYTCECIIKKLSFLGVSVCSVDLYLLVLSCIAKTICNRILSTEQQLRTKVCDVSLHIPLVIRKLL